MRSGRNLERKYRMIKRGQIYFIKSNHKEVGTEQWADRPAVIVSNNSANEHSSAVEVCYTTTKPKLDLPTHFITEGGLRPSTVICEQVTTVYNERIGKQIGELSKDEMKLLDQCLQVSLGLDKQADTEATKVMHAELEELTKACKERDFYKDLYEHLAKKALEG